MQERTPDYGVFDVHVYQALRDAEADPEAAAKVLLLASQYLATRQQMPAMLADFIALAFKSAALKPQENRAKQLTDDLFLTANNRRRVKADWYDAYKILKEMYGKTKNAAASELTKRSGISKTKADELIKQAAKYIEENE